MEKWLLLKNSLANILKLYLKIFIKAFFWKKKRNPIKEKKKRGNQKEKHYHNIDQYETWKEQKRKRELMKLWLIEVMKHTTLSV